MTILSVLVFEGKVIFLRKTQNKNKLQLLRLATKCFCRLQFMNMHLLAAAPTSISQRALELVAEVADILPVVRKNTWRFLRYSSHVKNFSCSAWNRRTTSPPRRASFLQNNKVVLIKEIWNKCQIQLKFFPLFPIVNINSRITSVRRINHRPYCNQHFLQGGNMLTA